MAALEKEVEVNPPPTPSLVPYGVSARVQRQGRQRVQRRRSSGGCEPRQVMRKRELAMMEATKSKPNLWGYISGSDHAPSAAP
jgi:hypothetical protein